MDSRILVYDNDELYQEVTTSILDKGDYNYTLVTTQEEFEQAVKEHSFDLALVDISVVRESDFDLIDFLRHKQNIHVILTTEEDIDQHFDLIVDKYITQVLNKPVKSSELLTVVKRLLNPDPATWFGLENYMTGIEKLKKIELKQSNQLRPTIDSILQYIDLWGFKFEMQFEMDLVWQEILTNAIYHSHGYSQQKKDRVTIRLPDPYKVVVRFGASKNQFGISVRDFRGTLTPKMVIGSLANAIEQQNLLERSLETGEDISDKILDRGRGLDLIRRMTGEYYFIIDPGHSTEIIIIYDGYFEKDDSYSSLKIFELPS